MLANCAALSEVTNQFKVVCLGDSITRSGYPEELEAMLNVRVINAGVNGNTSRGGLARLERHVLTNKPNLVLIFFGANDSRLDSPKTHVPLEEYKSNLTKMVDQCRERGAEVILGTPPPLEPEAYYQRHPREYYQSAGGLEAWLGRYRATVLKIGEEKHATVVDLHTLLAKETGWRKPDGVHPTKEGDKLIAKLFAEKVSPLIKKAQAGGSKQ